MNLEANKRKVETGNPSFKSTNRDVIPITLRFLIFWIVCGSWKSFLSVICKATNNSHPTPDPEK